MKDPRGIEKCDESAGGGKDEMCQRGGKDKNNFIVADESVPRLVLLLFVLSGAPEASPVAPGWPRGAGHPIGTRRTERAFGARDWVR